MDRALSAPGSADINHPPPGYHQLTAADIIPNDAKPNKKRCSRGYGVIPVYLSA
jgi:hypothetical protein